MGRLTTHTICAFAREFERKSRPGRFGVRAQPGWVGHDSRSRLRARQKIVWEISRPMEVVVLNCWVTETKDTHDIEQLDELGEVSQ